MRYLKLGDQNVSVIGLGAWQIGTNSWGWGTEFGPRDVQTLLETASEEGINFIDTAELYGQGESERQIGLSIGNLRSSFVIASKVSPWHLSYKSVYEAACKSLERLRITSIDLYQIHAPNPFMPIKGTMKGMSRLLSEGKIAKVGVSNFSLKRWQQAELELGSPIVTNQMEYSLARPRNYRLLGAKLDDNHYMIAYSPLGMGLLSGKYGNIKRPAGSRGGNPEFRYRNYPNVKKLLDVVSKIAKRHTASISQISLAWVIAKDRVIAIPGAKSVAQIRENAQASDINLTQTELHDLNEASKAYKQAVHLPTPFDIFKWLFTRG